MSESGSLAGKVSNHGAQVVKGPYSRSGKSAGGKVIRGDDLRSGSGKK